MKKITNKKKYNTIQEIKKKRYLLENSRKDKVYLNSFSNTSLDDLEYVKKRPSQSSVSKRIVAPKIFSFIYNTNESLKFFNIFFDAIEQGYTRFDFEMSKIEDLGIETLLYIISLDKIYNAKEKKIQIKISNPKKDHLKFKMYVSGFAKYFTKNLNLKNVDEKTIFPICDGATNKYNEKDDGETCGEAVEFVKQLIDINKHKDMSLRLLYTGLAELMQNTDDHAYKDESEDNQDKSEDNQDKSEDNKKINPDDIKRNWYLFAVQLQKGIAFYFFDNGEGITKTARKSILEKAYGLIQLKQEKILESTLNGEFRSATKLRNRNKGLPQVNDLLVNNDIISSVILTNKVLSIYDGGDTKTRKFKKIDYNFKGSLFVWILADNNEEIK
ncbi:hypothetical protein N5T67_03815 [Aliarcobacter butzleri]|uniref:hypothetical protein n=1 Tax=Aliarcobacter butzleri TaxID=28197 RepID=UPI0021B38D64|nr:hypothetical protein [Aliarcobacter butzleri]MCT7551960.1 hypothetical protein [Aliarcobacter butzleri]